MSNKLTKNVNWIINGYTPLVIPAQSPAPAYCVDITNTATSFYYEYVTVPPDPHVPGSGGVTAILVGPTTVTTQTHVCEPASSGTPEQTFQAPNFAVFRDGGWNGGAISIGALSADGQFKFSARADSVGIITGLTDIDPHDGSYLSIKYAIYCHSGVFNVVENGTQLTADVSYVGTDVFAVVRIGSVISYFKNTTLIYTSVVPSSGTVSALASMYMGGDEIDNASLSTTVDSSLASTSGGTNQNPNDVDPVTGQYVGGRLGSIVGASFGGGATSWNSVQGTLSGVRGSSLANLPVGSCAGVLNGVVGESYGNGVGCVCAGVLGGIVGHIESGLFTPQFAGADGTLSRVAGFSLAYAGMTAVGTGVLGGILGFAANAPNYVTTGTGSPPTSGGTDPTGGIDPVTGDWSGRGGGQLRSIVGFSYDQVVADRLRYGGRITLPALTVSGSINTGRDASANLILPWPLVVEGNFGASGDLVLPFLTLDASGRIDNVIRGDIPLPAPLTVAGNILAGTVAHGNLVLPFLTVTASGTLAGSAAVTLPLLRVAGRIYTDARASADLRLPFLKIAGSIGVPTGVLNGYLVLPMLVMARSGAGAMELPHLRVAATISQAPVGQPRLAYAMNIQNAALTTFSNFPFKQFARAYNRYFAVGLDGDLYLFGGDRDVSAVIDWEWESGLTDFGSPGQKGVLGVYLDGEIEKGATLTLVTDDARRVYTHTPRGAYNTHRPHRVSTGRGVRTRSIALGMASTVGGYLELDSITPEYVITPRNI